ncbi:unnamed protein product [Caenorhabditis brenneri]
MPSLLDMPDVVMTNVLEECGFKSVLNLRKVCHSLRSFVDAAIFKTDLDVFQITIGLNDFSVVCRKQNPVLTNEVSFAKNWTSNDLKIVLKLVENSKLSSFHVITNPGNVGGLDDLGEILKNQTRPTSDSSLKIWIKPSNYETDNQNLDGIEKVMELEQFRNAVWLTIDFRFLVRADVRKFFHLQELFVRLHETSLEELVALKEAFVTSTHMKLFDLRIYNLNENQLEQVFGTPSHDEFGCSQWFFEIQKCKEHVLGIRWDLSELLFWKMEAKKVPQDAVVYY